MSRRFAGIHIEQKLWRGAVRVCVLLTAMLPVFSPALAQESTGPRGPYFGQTSPGATAVLFAPELFQDPGEYHGPVVFSPDGTEAYWSPMPGHGRNTTLRSRMVDGVWTSQEYVDFGLEAGATEVAFSPDGATIFFLSTQLLPGERPAPGERGSLERIWYAPRSPDGIGTPRLMPEAVSAHPTHWQFSVAASGNLYFTSREPGPRADADIYLVPFDGTTYSRLRPLGKGVNGPGNENCPFIAPDESYLIFTRNDPEAYNPDLFISYRGSDGAWGEAERLPSPINSENTEIYPVVSPDGRYLFFLSWREGAGRIFWVETDFIRSPAAPIRSLHTPSPRPEASTARWR